MLNALDMTLAGVVGGVGAPPPRVFAKAAPSTIVRAPVPTAPDLPWHRSPGVAQRSQRPEHTPNPAPTSPAVFASIAYPTLRGLGLAPVLAFEAQRIAQEDPAPPPADSAAAAKAYGAPHARMTGFLGLLEPLDLSV